MSKKTNPLKQKYTVSTRDFYRDYRRQCIKEGITPISTIDHRKFIYDVFQEVWNWVMTKKFHFILPHELGEFYLKKKKWPRKKKKNNFIMNRFPHTLGFIFQFKWDRTYLRSDNRPFYRFKKSKILRKKLAQFYMQDVASGKERVPETYNFPQKTIILTELE